MPNRAPTEIEVHGGELSDAAIEALAKLLIDLSEHEANQEEQAA